jgi:hypothetical protein
MALLGKSNLLKPTVGSVLELVPRVLEGHQQVLFGIRNGARGNTLLYG